MAAASAVQDFWDADTQYRRADDRADYVEWAIPTEDDEPSPFTWANVDETDDENIVSCYLSHSMIYKAVLTE
jgi:hypothetical protein